MSRTAQTSLQMTDGTRREESVRGGEEKAPRVLTTVGARGGKKQSRPQLTAGVYI